MQIQYKLYIMKEKLRDKKILVTGGAGFIGSHLCDKLMQAGARVICVDNFFTGKKENVLHLMDNPEFKLYDVDVNNREELAAVFSGEKINYIFHYAAVLGVQRVMEKPLLVLPDIDGIRNILELAQEHQVKKVIFASSSEAYGDTAELPLREDNNRDLAHHGRHTHLYALVKLMGERIMKIYNDQYKVPTCSLRFFNVFGPRQESSAYGFVVGVFIKQIIAGQAPTIFGDGYQTRDFIYIDDNIRLAIKALLSSSTDGQVINIGAGRQTTILDLAEKLIRISGQDLTPKLLPARQYEIKYRSPDITKMRDLLNEIIPERLEENLRETYEWYVDNN